jgi:ATP phosphoribosyltransferase
MGLEFHKNDGDLLVSCSNADVEILFVRCSDIPIYVEKNVADFGILGENILYERRSELDIVQKLGFGKCSLIIAVPDTSSIENPDDLEDERIATSYPYSVKKYLKKNKVNASIIEIKGSVELAPSLNLADAICDITQTGRTLRNNNLKIIDTVFHSEVVLVGGPTVARKALHNFQSYLIKTS